MIAAPFGAAIYFFSKCYPKLRSAFLTWDRAIFGTVAPLPPPYGGCEWSHSIEQSFVHIIMKLKIS